MIFFKSSIAEHYTMLRLSLDKLIEFKRKFPETRPETQAFAVLTSPIVRAAGS